MATKSISTRISLTGEQEWRRSIDACKAALSEYKSEINLVNAQYKENANSLDALIAKEKGQSKYVNELQNASRLYKQRLDELKGALESQEKESAEYQDKLNRLNSVLEKHADLQERHPKLYEKAQERLRQLTRDIEGSQEAEKNWNAEISRTQAQLNSNEKALLSQRAELDKTRATLETVKDPAKNFGMAVADMTAEMQAAVVVMQKYVNSGVKALYDALSDSVKQSLEFESAMTKVQKTTNMTESELYKFGQSLKDLSVNIPITTNELSKIAEVAGQLGVASEDLEQFTKVMAMMEVSTDLTAEEAATSLAQIASVTGLTVDNYERLASSIVAVGNNFATTESQVAMLVQRLAGAAMGAGIAEADMVGLATAIKSLGIGAEVGGTAMQTLINKMETAVSTGDGLEAWASAMNMSTERLSELWRSDATEALRQFIGALGDSDESMINVLKSVGIGEQRLIRVVSLLANAEHSTDLLTRALETSNVAWEENTALQTEASKQFETAQSKIEMFENSLNNLKISIGDDLLPILGQAAEAGNKGLQVITQFVEDNPAVVAAISGLLTGLTAISAVAGIKTVASLQAVQTALTTLKASITALMGGGGALLVALTAVGAAMAVVVANTESYTKSAKEAAKSTKELIKQTDENIASVKEEHKNVEAQIAMIEDLIAVEDKSAGQKALLGEMIADLNEMIPSLNARLSEEGDALVSVSTNAKITTTDLHNMAQAMAAEAVQEEKLATLKQLYVDKIKYTEQLEAQKEKLRLAQEKWTNAEIRDFNTASQYDAEINDLIKSIRVLEEALGIVTDKIGEYDDGLSESSDTNVKAVDNMQKTASALLRQQEMFTTTKKAAEEQMAGVVGSFEGVAKASTKSYETIMKNLQSQIDYMKNYSDNLASLQGRNIAGIQDFATKFTDGTRESAEMLASFAKMSDSQIKAIIAKYNEVPPVLDSWSTGLGKVAAKTQLSVEEMMKQYNRLQRTIKATRDLASYYGGNYTDEEIWEKTMNGSHAQGLEYVPFDDYAAKLHEGEMVLTKAEARAYRATQTTGQSVTNNNRNYGGVSINVYSRQGQDIDSLADEIMYRIEDATKRKEAVWA